MQATTPLFTVPCYNLLTVSELAGIARKDAGWGKKGVNFAAKPYLDAMRDITSVGQSYFQDSAKEIVLRFLGNATSWKGEVARAIKKELNARLKK